MSSTNGTSATASDSVTACDVIIVGAGPAGIAAGRTISTLSPNSTLIILEGRNRLGGRAHTSHAVGQPIDLGASWIHHFSPSNPIVPLAKLSIQRQLGLSDDEFNQLNQPPAPPAAAILRADAAAESDTVSPTPVLATAAYCGFIDMVDEQGRAVHLPSPFPGLGGGVGRFVLFDHDGTRIPHTVYVEAVRIYNALMAESERMAEAFSSSLPALPPLPAGSTTASFLTHSYHHYSQAVAAVDQSVLAMIQPAYTKHLASHPAPSRDQLERVIDFLLSGGEQFEGASLDRMSGLYWQAGSDGSGEVECDMLVQRGYGDLISDLGSNLPVLFRHVVTAIDYSDAEHVIVAANVEDEQERVVRKIEFRCRHIIVTLPLGVLKRGAVHFHPPLPATKQHAIDTFGFGLMNKVVLQFDSNWWGDDIISIGYCSSRERGEYRWILSLQPTLDESEATLRQREGRHKYSDEQRAGSRHILCVFSTASVGIKIEETKSDEQQVADVMQILTSIFTRHQPAATSAAPSSTPAHLTADTVLGSDRELLYSGPLRYLSSVPKPVGVLVSRWWSDRFCYGSYSHYALGSNEWTVDALAQPSEDGRIGWAGEHTSSTSIGCVDSAWSTGIREGERIAKLLAENQKVEQHHAGIARVVNGHPFPAG